MGQRLEFYASCRLTRSERKAVELAAANKRFAYVSDWVRQAVLNQLCAELGDEISSVIRTYGRSPEES